MSLLQLYTRHLALKIIDVVLQTIPEFHLNREEMVVVPLEFLPRSKLVVEFTGHVVKVSE